MSTDTVNRQIREAKEKIERAKEQIAFAEKAIQELERNALAQSEGRSSGRQHSD